MKANRKFLADNDEGVSPVIAVILMVAITVVLAATVYVWVSGFGASGSQAKNLSVAEVSCTGSNPVAKFTIVSVSPNFAFSALKVSDGTTGRASDAGATAAAADSKLGLATSGGATLAAGDTLTITSADANDMVCTDTLNFIDTAANSVVATITLFAKA